MEGMGCLKAWVTFRVRFVLSCQVTYHIAIDAASIARDLRVAMNLFREMRARYVLRPWSLFGVSEEVHH